MRNEDAHNRIITLLNSGKYSTALPLLHEAMQHEPSDWNNFYMAGQCCRFTNDLEGAFRYLRKALNLNPTEPRIWLAIGIAFQLMKRPGQAIEAFRGAIQLDPDYELAYNSLAVTLEELGQLSAALESYQGGLKALSQRIVKGLENNRANPIYDHHGDGCRLWFDWALYGATYLVAVNPEIKEIALPSASFALDEEESRRHEGLYWLDQFASNGVLTRLFLPNYFETFCEALKSENSYATLIDNLGFLLQEQGRVVEAQVHFQEAQHFLPKGVDPNQFPRFK